MNKQLLLEGFEEKFCDNGPIGEYDSIKNFISKAIAQTREETIKEILTKLRLKLRNTYKAEDIADTAFLTESDLESVLNL
jgi:urate oxidase